MTAERLADNPELRRYWEGMLARRAEVDAAAVGVAGLGTADIAVVYSAVADVAVDGSGEHG